MASWLPRVRLARCLALQLSLETTTVLHSDIFEPMSDEYAAVSSSHPLTPPSPSQSLVTLVAERNFKAANALRKELMAHHVPIQRDALYLHAALDVISRRCIHGSKARLDGFEAWLSLAPDRHQEHHSFDNIRERIFGTMEHLNIPLVYRFGLVLASKGYYSGIEARQVVSTLARYAPLSLVHGYLDGVLHAVRAYHSEFGTLPPKRPLTDVYNLFMRTIALAGKSDAALDLIPVMRSRSIHLSKFTLNVIAMHAPDRQVAVDHIRAAYPSWTLPHTPVRPTKNIPAIDSPGTAKEAARAIRAALTSPSPPTSSDLQSFMTSYKALGHTRSLKRIRVLAYRHSPKSASTWLLTEMLHHRSRQAPLHLLFLFSRYFHPVGIPQKLMFSLLSTPHARRECHHIPTLRVTAKLWPSAHHTALVWEALLVLSPTPEKERLYALLISFVRQSRRQEQEQVHGQPRSWLQLPPDTYDAAHFSPFVSMWARGIPERALSVLQDMARLGIEPSTNQWSTVARGFAQRGDPLVALRILDRIEGACPSDVLLKVYTKTLYGFLKAGDVQHAREVERRLVEGLGYQTGQSPLTDARIALLRRLEGRTCALHVPRVAVVS